MNKKIIADRPEKIISKENFFFLIILGVFFNLYVKGIEFEI